MVPSALAYAFFFTGIKKCPGRSRSIVTLVEPLTAMALATAFLGERLAPAALAGGLLVLAAVAGLYLHRLRADEDDARTAAWTASVDRSDERGDRARAPTRRAPPSPRRGPGAPAAGRGRRRRAAARSVEDVGQQVERLVGLPDAERSGGRVVLDALVEDADVEADRAGQLRAAPA